MQNWKLLQFHGMTERSSPGGKIFGGVRPGPDWQQPIAWDPGPADHLGRLPPVHHTAVKEQLAQLGLASQPDNTYSVQVHVL